MPNYPRLLGALLLAATLCAPTIPRAESSAAAVPEGWTFTFPQGNARDGRVTYERMDCAACHAKKGTRKLRGTSGTGPDLSSYASLPREYLAESIITAHTVVAAPGYAVREGKAGMGNYNHFMTVQELTDLVEFLRDPGGGR